MNPMRQTPKLTVLLVTYNHEPYIDQALESLFRQDFSGPIELVVADDASNDATLARIRRHEGRDDRFVFKYLDADTNVGITRNYQRGFAACNSEFVAVLEGDDHWCSPHKLTRQVAFLDSHWECDLCAVNYFVFDEANGTFTERTTPTSGHRLLHARDLIADNLIGNFSTCMYRKSALAALPDALFNLRSYDWIVNICVSSRSLIGFLQEPMSVYRVHAGGAWSNQSQLDKLRLQLELIPQYDQLTQQRFHTAFKALERSLARAIRLQRIELPRRGVLNALAAAAHLLHDLSPPLLTAIARALTPPALARRLASAKKEPRA